MLASNLLFGRESRFLGSCDLQRIVQEGEPLLEFIYTSVYARTVIPCELCIELYMTFGTDISVYVYCLRSVNMHIRVWCIRYCWITVSWELRPGTCSCQIADSKDRLEYYI